jgi:glycosyltransferase involved in cell wall biosynthesis
VDASVPLLSVVITTYNRPERLAKAIRSVLEQTNGNIEIIIVDDFSDIKVNLSEFQPDVRLKMVRNPSNQGVSIARNRGIARASAAWTTFLDDDDHWDPRFVETMLSEIGRHPAADFAWSDVTFINESTGEVSHRRHVQDWSKIRINRGKLTSENYKSLPAELNETAGMVQAISVGCGFGLTVRTELLCKMGGFRPHMSRAEDTDLIVRLLKDKRTYFFLNSPLVNITIHKLDENIKKSRFDEIITNTLSIVEQYPSFFSDFPMLRGHLITYLKKMIDNRMDFLN